MLMNATQPRTVIVQIKKLARIPMVLVNVDARKGLLSMEQSALVWEIFIFTVITISTLAFQ